MKKLLIGIVFLIFPGMTTINAQKDPVRKKAGIYALNITLESEFVKLYSDNLKDSPKTGFAISAFLPDTIIEAVKKLSEELCQNKLKADVICIYDTNKKGEKVTSKGWGRIEGMPVNTFKGAVESTELDFYIIIDVLMRTGGESVYLGKGFNSKIKPWVIASIKVYNREKNEVYENNVSMKDFSKLRSKQLSTGIFDESFSEVINPVDLYMIYELTLIKLTE